VVLQARLQIERKIKDGAENLLSVFETGGASEGNKEDLRKQVENELEGANSRIASLETRIAELSVAGDRPCIHIFLAWLAHNAVFQNTWSRLRL
jgi:Hr1 repeat